MRSVSGYTHRQALAAMKHYRSELTSLREVVAKSVAANELAMRERAAQVDKLTRERDKLHRDWQFQQEEVARCREALDQDRRDVNALVDAMHVLSRKHELPMGRVPRGLDRLQMSQLSELDMERRG